MANVLASTAVILFGLVASGIADDYPNRPIRLVVPWGAGGSSSMSARIIAQQYALILEQAMIVVNKPGAGGAIGAAFAKKARPDGYTLFQFNSGSNGDAILRPNIGYTNEDFNLIGQYAVGHAALAVRADAPWRTAKELVDYAKENPGKLKYAAGVAGTARFAAELFKAEAGGLDIPRVPAKSGAAVNQLLLSGNVDLCCAPATDVRALVDSGQMRFLAFCDEERNKDYPDVPTFKEVGYPGIVISTWYGLAAPLGIPEEVSRILRGTLAKIMQQEAVRGQLNNLGYTASYKNAEDFRVFVKDMEQLYQKVAENAGIEFK